MSIIGEICATPTVAGIQASTKTTACWITVRRVASKVFSLFKGIG